MDLLAALLQPEAYPEPTQRVEFLQTYISYIFLTDKHAYKIKKPVNFGYLDFSTLRKRHYYLEQELLLNRRLAPEMYLAVLPVVQRRGRLFIGGRGEPREYALQMLRLPQHLMMDEIAARGELTAAMMASQMAAMVTMSLTELPSPPSALPPWASKGCIPPARRNMMVITKTVAADVFRVISTPLM